jgi:hypothetical protein
MQFDLLRRVVRHFVALAAKSVVEDIIGAAALIVVIVRPFVSKVQAPVWTAFEEGSMVLVAMAAYFLLRAVHSVWMEIASQPEVKEVESLLYLPGDIKSRELVKLPSSTLL